MGVFFAQAVESGAHLNSIQMVVDGVADLAAIDCVSFAFFERLYPNLLARIKVIGQTPLTPGLPLITNTHTSVDEIKNIQNALTATVADASLSEACSALRIKNFSPLSIEAYDVCLDMQHAAASQGVLFCE